MQPSAVPTTWLQPALIFRKYFSSSDSMLPSSRALNPSRFRVRAAADASLRALRDSFFDCAYTGASATSAATRIIAIFFICIMSFELFLITCTLVRTVSFIVE